MSRYNWSAFVCGGLSTFAVVDFSRGRYWSMAIELLIVIGLFITHALEGRSAQSETLPHE